MKIDITRVRNQFPSLHRSGIFFDNPGGTQISKPALDRMSWYFREANAQRGGHYSTSHCVDEAFAQARSTFADFINAKGPSEIIFGNNMTTLTFTVSRSLGHMLTPGDRILLTHLEHDGNVAPWLYLAEERGLIIDWVDINPEDCTLDLESLKRALEKSPKLLAIGYASNFVGTINPLETIIPMAHKAGALVYVDAVQYAPHNPIDVQKLDCDFLVCSPYKFFGPHMGVLYAKFELLEKLFPYKVRPSSNVIPMRFETGTLNQEGIAGLWGTMEFFEWLGTTFGSEHKETLQNEYSNHRLLYKQAMAANLDYEYEISRRMLSTLKSVPGLTLYGIADEKRIEERVPTFSFKLDGWTPSDLAEALGNAGIYVMYGNFYALDTSIALKVEQHGGLVRAGATLYNTFDEIDYLGKVLLGLSSHPK
jgi:cysteine desulfurase family protein (TIGR01976 family)